MMSWPNEPIGSTHQTRRTLPTPTYLPPHRRPSYNDNGASQAPSYNRFKSTQFASSPPTPGRGRRHRSGRGRGRGRGRDSFRAPSISNRNLTPYNNTINKFEQLELKQDDDDDAVDTTGNSEGKAINFDAYEDIPVEVTGSDVPPPVASFAEIDLGEALKQNIKRCKYVKPTPVQRHAMPIVVAGRDLMACAQTGSGKTAAFCFPIIRGILSGPFKRVGLGRGGCRVAYPTALILSPTRELSRQIHDEAKKFAHNTEVKVVVAYGGAPIVEQFRNLEKGVDILVATPGRLVDMIDRSRVSLKMIKYLALDEADRMLDMGFEHQIRKIVEQMGMPPPGSRQTVLFSATFPDEIQRLASDFLSNYIFLTVGKVGSSTDLISQKVELVEEMDKRSHLMNLLCTQKPNGFHGKPDLTLIFVETKRGADALEQWLSRNGLPAIAIHGDKVQWEREHALRSFKKGITPILVATDVASRGLDIPNVAHVINFDMPKDIDDYVHRIGRTGRAGNSGLATAFFSDKNLPLAKPLVDLMQHAKQEVPSWLNQYAENSSFAGSGRASRYGHGNFGGSDFRTGSQAWGDNYYHSSTNGDANSVADSFNTASGDVVYAAPASTDYYVYPTVSSDAAHSPTDFYAPAYEDSFAAGSHGYGSIDAGGWD